MCVKDGWEGGEEGEETADVEIARSLFDLLR